MGYYRTNELYHHGILGQRWGVRRYQNKDGTLTNAGKSRYGRGKDIRKDREHIKQKEYERLLKTDKEFNKAYNEAMRIMNKYGLDYDDGGGGDSTRWSEEQLKRAGQRYWDYSEDYSARQEILSEKAKKYADDQILKKYGQIGVADMNYYDNVSSAIGVGAFMAIMGGAIAISLKS